MRHLLPTSSHRSLQLSFAAALGLLMVVQQGCGGGCDNTLDPEPGLQNTAAPLVKVDGANCSPLLAGQTIEAGTVCAAVDGDDLKLTYTTTDGWTLSEAHLWVGTSLSGMPQTNKGSPIPGQFPYKAENLPDGTTTVTLAAPLSIFGLQGSQTECVPVNALVAAHAAVRKVLPDGTVQTETGWGQGPRIVSKGNWATYFNLVLTCEGDPNPPEWNCGETAFAHNPAAATCFIGSPWLAAERWGWTNGPFAEGTHTFDVYAGAGQCDLAKGTKVGTATAVYAAGKMTVTLTAGPDYRFSETHLYVGTEPLPRKDGIYTVSPGQYPWQHTLSFATTDTFEVNGLSGDVNVILHAVSCAKVTAN